MVKQTLDSLLTLPHLTALIVVRYRGMPRAFVLIFLLIASAVWGMTPSSQAKRLVLVNAQQPQYLDRLVAQIGHAAAPSEQIDVVFLHRADALAVAEVDQLVGRLATKQVPPFVKISTFSDRQQSLRSPSAAPLLLAASFLEQIPRENHSVAVIYLDGMRSAWCQDVFASADFSDAARLYKLDGCWGIPSCQKDVTGPYFFAGSLQAVGNFFSIVKQTFDCSDGVVDGTRLAQFAIDRYEAAWVGSVQSMPSAVTGHPNAPVCTAARDLLRSDEERRFESRMSLALCGASGNGSVALIVDIALCTDGPRDEQFGDFCPATHTRDLYAPSSSTGHDLRVQVVQQAKPSAFGGLGTVRSNLSFANLKAMRKERNMSKYGECGKAGVGLPSAVIGIAGGYHVDVFSNFVNTFLAVTDMNCTDLILFVSDVAKTREVRPAWSKVTLISVSDYSIVETPSKCGWSDKRFELYYQWLSANAHRYFMAAMVDVRDVLFQADPFASLFKSKTWTKHFSNISAEDELLLPSMEEYVASSSSSYATAAFVFFNLWHDAGIAQQYRKMLQTLQFSETNEHLPVLCSGLVVGTAKALLHLTYAQVMFFKGDVPCGFDQGIFQMLAVDGLVESGYSGTIAFFNPHFWTMRNGAERPQDVLWKDGRLVNCYGEAYSIIHQFEQGRHPWAGDRIARAVMERARRTT